MVEPAVGINEPSSLPGRRSTPVDWTAVSAVTSAIALVLVAASLFYSAAQIRTTREIAQSQFMLDYYTLSQNFNDLQMRLVDGGEWDGGVGPESAEDWFRVARYMGLLEQIEVFVETNVMSVEIADATYSHRIHALYRNDAIRSRYLEGEAYRWQLFLKLVERLETMPVFSGLSQ